MAYFNLTKFHLYSIFVFSVSILYMLYRLKRSKRYVFSRKAVLNSQIYILSSETSNVQEIGDLLLKETKVNPILGFDCEWVTENKRRRPVALLQLATYNHICVLIRLNTLKTIPKIIQEILIDPDILKVGVAAIQDAQYLRIDYGVKVRGTLDLRHLTGKPNGLAAMAKDYLGFVMDKNWRIRCSNWENRVLTQLQVQYAAQDALIAVELLKKLGQYLDLENIFPYIDVQYSNKIGDIQTNNHTIKWFNKQVRTPKIIARQTPLYNNCYMEAPDGELLCTCDRKKAEWYISKELADLIKNDPFTIRLRFEPAGRAVGDVGQYYTKAKLNRCVVCGRPDSYIRKNVVPREYRKLFPLVMKEHTSHDILLLCVNCHQASNMSDNVLRNKLAELCDAPIGKASDIKVRDSPAGRELRSAARALTKSADKLPLERKKFLEETVLKYFPDAIEVNESILNEAYNVAISIQNEDYEPHGQKVVEYFISHSQPDFKNALGNGGLTQLEQEWRQHFLTVMRPKYMPELWSVKHNEHRLEIRAEEGRVDNADLRIAGCIDKL